MQVPLRVNEFLCRAADLYPEKLPGDTPGAMADWMPPWQ
jgi:hypothetical protein